MAIAKCIHCPAYYWSYRGDFPPAGYCSIKCYEERRRPKKKEAPPEPPQTVLLKMYEHRREVHGSASILADFACEECERLEATYSDALRWHQKEADTALRQADKAERRRPSPAKAG